MPVADRVTGHPPRPAPTPGCASRRTTVQQRASDPTPHCRRACATRWSAGVQLSPGHRSERRHVRKRDRPGRMGCRDSPPPPTRSGRGRRALVLLYHGFKHAARGGWAAGAGGRTAGTSNTAPTAGRPFATLTPQPSAGRSVQRHRCEEHLPCGGVLL